MRALFATVVVMALVSAVSADMVVDVSQNPDPQVGLESYTVRFVGSTAGDRFSAFDGRFEGPMSQTWYAFKGWMTTVWVGDFALPTEAASAAVDSHMLIDPHDAAHVLVASEPNEDLDTTGWVPGVTPTPDVNGYQRGLGTYMSTTATSNMAFAIPGAYQTINQVLAQIVIPAGETVYLNCTAVGYNGQGLVLVDYPIPEPASMALLALGAAGVILRRRRR